MVDFTPIKKTYVAHEIIEQVVKMVRGGSLKTGHKLPSERQLCEKLQVGRSSVREAMKALETVGLLKRTREGTVLSDLGEMENPDLWLGAYYSEIHDVFETRKLMEIELAGLAAQRATPKDIKAMADAIDEIRESDLSGHSDISFHRAIAGAAKNTVFSQVYKLVTGLLFQTHKYYSLIETNKHFGTYLKEIVKQHREILSAIKSKNPNAAKKAMKRHLDYAENELIGRVIKDVPKPRKNNSPKKINKATKAKK